MSRITCEHDCGQETTEREPVNSLETKKASGQLPFYNSYDQMLSISPLLTMLIYITVLNVTQKCLVT